MYGSTPQPFITEVFVSIDTTNLDPVFTTAILLPPPKAKVSPKGYIAIELYNPYPFPLSLNGWQLGAD